MRWITVALISAALSVTFAAPEPKKYQPEVKTKDKHATTTLLTEEERKFLREVEAKFGIKTDVPLDSYNVAEDDDSDISESSEETEKETPVKAPFPAIIAIEIVNDTDTKTKGKRTIDANLGYGYRTNNGYSYTYLGKSEQEKGKFMIYPYSQHDIPPAQPNTDNSDSKSSPNVEITPSQAYELVPEKDPQTAYHYEKPSVEFKTKYEAQGVESPPPPYPTADTATPSTLYTTYNGQQFSGLSGQFPSVMPKYLVDPSQLLKSPQYQSAGLTQDYLRSHGSQLQQRVVPVLVLRIPSSYLKTPTAELYADLPKNYPISHYLNNVNLQELVNQYFKKIGYSHAPQVMAYQNSVLSTPETHVSSALSSHTPQQYATPYVQPTYTHSDYSGVQYSAVQPVMAKYPSGYRQQYYITRGQSLYHQPLQQQQYVYQYRYLPQSSVQAQPYYTHQTAAHPQYHYQVPSHVEQQEQVVDHQAGVHETNAHVKYVTQHQPASHEYSSVEYAVQQTPAPQYEPAVSVTPNYESVDTATSHHELANIASSEEHGPTQVHLPTYGTQASQYHQPIHTESVAVYSRGQTGHRHGARPQQQTYAYQNQVHHDSDDHGLVLTENYPSKDHTIATVLPLSYKNRRPHPEPVQAVSYVTPVPHSMKYHSQYRVMVPQTVFRPTTSEKVSYVNSHSVPSYGSSNPEEEYTLGAHFVPPIGKQRPPSYPRNYHSHPKRMLRPDHKSETVTIVKKHMDKKRT